MGAEKFFQRNFAFKNQRVLRTCSVSQRMRIFDAVFRKICQKDGCDEMRNRF